MADRALFITVVTIFTISLVLTYSLSTFSVRYYGYGDFHFLIRQIIAVLLGIFIMVSMSWLDPGKWFVPIGFALFVFSLGVMIAMPFLPESMVKTILGAKRWIRLGPVSLAPVEFFKIGFVFFVSWSFSRKIVHHGKLSLEKEIRILLPYLLLFVLAVVLIAIFQKDLGQTVVLAMTLIVLLVIAGRSMKLFFLFILIGFISFVVLVLIAPHRMQRIKSWWSTVQDNFLSFFPEGIVEKIRVPEANEPYQISNSLNAIHNGGFFGQGLGNGQFKLGYLSEVHTDFILSGLSEELGYLSLLTVSMLMLYIVYRILQVASRLNDSSYYLFCVGIAQLILFAFIVNSYGISGITPIKGIAVPLLSYGGSQIIAGSIAIGMVLMISKKADS